MKDNTIFHCGSEQVKYSCFAKAANSGRKRGKRYFLRATDRGSSRSTIRRITSAQVGEYLALNGLEPRITWCGERMAEEGRKETRIFQALTPHDLIPVS